MNKEENRGKTAYVCYCLLPGDGRSGRMDQVLQQVQELFEDAGFHEVKQAFVVGRAFPSASPFAVYPLGFRVRTGQEMERQGTGDEGDGRRFGSAPENLVLSYGLFRGLGQEMALDSECFLILLREGSTAGHEKQMINIIRDKYVPLRRQLKLHTVCLAQPEEAWEAWEQDFAEACGIETMTEKFL